MKIAVAFLSFAALGLSAALGCSSSTTSGTSSPSCTVVSGDGGPACGQVVNLCTNGDSCYITVGSQTIPCTSCSDRTSCEATLATTCPDAPTCTSSTMSCGTTTVTTCTNDANTCYFLVGTDRIDCASCSEADTATCAAKVTAACTTDSGAGDSGP